MSDQLVTDALAGLESLCHELELPKIEKRKLEI